MNIFDLVKVLAFLVPGILLIVKPDIWIKKDLQGADLEKTLRINRISGILLILGGICFLLA
jgi:hypothetical protein